MGISFENALGLHERALLTRLHRSEVLAGNLANADTPGFKARDIDFHEALKQASAPKQSPQLDTTHQRHMNVMAASGPDLLYRHPLQPSLDGNTVDTQTELLEFSRNTMEYQVNFQFLNSRFSGLMRAIKGE